MASHFLIWTVVDGSRTFHIFIFIYGIHLCLNAFLFRIIIITFAF